MQLLVPCYFFFLGTAPEYEVLTKNFSALVNTLKYTDFYRYYVSEGIITLDCLEELSVESSQVRKVQQLLCKISSTLRDGNLKPFNTLLKIMVEHGDSATKQLAEEIKESLSNWTTDSGIFML